MEQKLELKDGIIRAELIDDRALFYLEVTNRNSQSHYYINYDVINFIIKSILKLELAQIIKDAPPLWYREFFKDEELLVVYIANFQKYISLGFTASTQNSSGKFHAVLDIDDNELKDVLRFFNALVYEHLSILKEAIENPHNNKFSNRNYFKEDYSSAEVFIALPQSNLALSQIESVQNACGKFMEALGYELKTQDEPVYGSFFQQLWFKLTSKKTTDEVTDLYDKGKAALEARLLNLPTAEATEKLANAASNIINSLESIDEAALRLGMLLIVKVQVNGKPTLCIETVSPKIASLLDGSPKILKNPIAVFELLESEKARIEAIGEGEGSEVV